MDYEAYTYIFFIQNKTTIFFHLNVIYIMVLLFNRRTNFFKNTSYLFLLKLN